MAAHITSFPRTTGRAWIAAALLSGLPLLAVLPGMPGRSALAATLPDPDDVKEPAPLTERQKQVLKSLQMGIEHLKATQTPQGTWQRGQQHPVGYAAMPALALLEVGVPTNDPAILRAAQFVRNSGPRIDETYEIALSILFLNRLADARDVPLIRSLALRLIAGQGPGGGWSYRCPILSAAHEKQLLAYLEKNQPAFAEADKLVMHPFLRPVPKGMEGLIDPLIKKEREASLADLYAKPPADSRMTIPTLIPKESKYQPGKQTETQPGYEPKTPEPKTKSDAGQNTGDAPGKLQPKDQPRDDQPRTKDVPKGKEPKDAPKPGPGLKPGNQLKPSGPPPPKVVAIYQWPNVQAFVKQMLLGANAWAAPQVVEDNSNTQFAILGLWAARKHNVPMALTLVRLDQRFRNSQFFDGSWSYHVPGSVAVNPKSAHLQKGTPSMTCVGLMGLGVAHGAFQEAALAQKKNPAPPNFLFDPSIQKGLTALSRSVDPRIKFEGTRLNLYFFWSLERIMVMYHLPTLGGHDWHEWGTDILLSRQTAAGSWDEKGYHGSSEPIDTSMALLFLSRANLNRDLSESLRRYLVVVDPARVKAP